MIVIEYCEEGLPVSDFNYKDWLNLVKNTRVDHCFKVSTSLPIQLIRLAIVKGEISRDDIIFKYFENTFQANQYGAIANWPLGFCDREIGICEEIIRCAFKKKTNKEIDVIDVTGLTKKGAESVVKSMMHNYSRKD